MKDKTHLKDFVHLVMYCDQLLKIAASSVSSPGKEIGGWLWGFVTNSGEVVVLYASLASKDSLKTSVNFQETAKHLESCAKLLYEHYRLEIVGCWHSHHRIGLKSPSGGDQKTGNSFASKNNINTFVEIIVTLEGAKDAPKVHIHPYAYKSGKTVGMFIDAIDGDSPISENLENTVLCENIIRPNIEIQESKVSWPSLPEPTPPPPQALIEAINLIPETLRKKVEVTYDAESTTIQLPINESIQALLSFTHLEGSYCLSTAKLVDDNHKSFDLSPELSRVDAEPISNLFLLLLHYALGANEETSAQHQLAEGGQDNE